MIANDDSILPPPCFHLPQSPITPLLRMLVAASGASRAWRNSKPPRTEFHTTPAVGAVRCHSAAAPLPPVFAPAVPVFPALPTDDAVPLLVGEGEGAAASCAVGAAAAAARISLQEKTQNTQMVYHRARAVVLTADHREGEE